MFIKFNNTFNSEGLILSSEADVNTFEILNLPYCSFC